MNELNVINYIKNSIPKQKIKDTIKELKENTCIYCSSECVEIDGTYWEVGGIIKTLEKLLLEVEDE